MQIMTAAFKSSLEDIGYESCCVHTYGECQVFLHESSGAHTAQVGQLLLQLDDTLKCPK